MNGIFVQSILFLFPMPYMAFAVTYGDELIYRGMFLLWMLYSNLVILMTGFSRKKLSGEFKIIALILGINIISSCLYNVIELSAIDISAVIKVVILLNALYIFETMTGRPVQNVFRAAAPLAALLIIISMVHFLLFPTKAFTRYLYFSIHPNLGGELLFACVALLYLRGTSWLLLFCGVLALIGTHFLQSRSALLAVVIVLFFAFGGQTLRLLRNNAGIGMLMLVLSGILAFFIYTQAGNALITDAVTFVADRVLLLNDQHRGIGSGLSGRDETWKLAFSLFVERPVLGVGIDQSGATDTGAKIHTGPFVIFAEFGSLGLILLFLLMRATWRSYFRNFRVFVVLLASLVVFLFQARGLNLNIFPLLMWIMVLPWRSAGSAQAPQERSLKSCAA